MHLRNTRDCALLKRPPQKTGMIVHIYLIESINLTISSTNQKAEIALRTRLNKSRIVMFLTLIFVNLFVYFFTTYT